MFKVLIHKLGIDKSIAYSSGARVVQSFTGVIGIFFIAQFLSKAEQGFYYTFGSILAIQVFFELGLTTIITQYVAHEMSGLKWVDNVNLTGNQRNHSRLAHLLRFCVKWYSIICIIRLLVLIISGYVFFNYYSPVNEKINWEAPWILVSIGTIINLFISPLLSIVMGLDRVKDVMKMRFYQQLIIPLSSWLGLAIGFNLYVLGISSILSVLYVAIYSFKSDIKDILCNLWEVKITEKVGYRSEIFPYQWRIALSWISGYFIYQIFNPVLFATEGPIVAGQMGMTLTALNGISAFSQSWINTKIPLMSKLIALKKYLELDRIFHSTFKQVSFICFLLLIIFIVAIWGLKFTGISLGYRFLNWVPLIMMIIPLYLNQWIFCMGTYIRCHKKEPFLINSIVIAVLCSLSTIIMGKFYGVNGITTGYCIITVINLFWVYEIFNREKKEWHTVT